MSRQYLPIWEAIVLMHKEQKPVQIRCPIEAVRRVKKAVIKEKNRDIRMNDKFLLLVGIGDKDESGKVITGTAVITFSLKPRICIDNL